MSLLRYFQLLRVSARRVPAITALRAESSVATATAAVSDGAASHEERAGEGSGVEDGSTKAGPTDLPSFDMENPFQPERKLCIACKNGINFDYKNFRLISQFTSTFTGKLFGRHVTGLCKTQHEKLKLEHMKAVMCGYITEQMKENEFRHDPKLCDVANPVRPHKYA